MNFDQYQEKANETAVYPNVGHNIAYVALGLGEAGEIQNKVKKIFRDDSGLITTKRCIELSKELGDLLWYIAQMCTELGLSLNNIAELNIAMLQDRKNRNKIHGSGDNR